MADTLNKFGVPVDGERAGMLMPKTGNKFRVRFTNFGPLNAQQSIALTRNIESCDKPQFQTPEQEVHSYNSIMYYAGKGAWQPITVIVRDEVTNAVTKLVHHQLQKQKNHFEQTTTLAGSDYKFNMYIEVLDGGNTEVIEKWFVEGAWLTNVAHETMNYQEATVQRMTMSIRFDNATLEDGLMTDSPELLSGTRL